MPSGMITVAGGMSFCYAGFDAAVGEGGTFVLNSPVPVPRGPGLERYQLLLSRPEQPESTGVMAYRAVPADRLDVPNMEAFTKWWGPNPKTQSVTSR